MLILVDSENTQHLANAYQINDLNNLIEATQFKAAFNETLSLIGQIPTSPNTALVGVGKAAELQAAKLVKIAQTIIKASQKKFKHISLDLSALPAELHYLFALSLTQAAYAFDEFKSKKKPTTYLNRSASLLVSHRWMLRNLNWLKPCNQVRALHVT